MNDFSFRQILLFMANGYKIVMKVETLPADLAFYTHQYRMASPTISAVPPAWVK
jgi:hypothetical protein